MKPLTKKWRAQGFRVIVYIDDGINIAASYKKCEFITRIIVNDLISAGFTINTEKSRLQPTQVGEWLGSVINTRDMTFSVPQGKIDKLTSSIYSILLKKRTTAKELARVAGQLSSMHASLGPIVQVLTRGIYTDITSRKNWHSYFRPSNNFCVSVPI